MNAREAERAELAEIAATATASAALQSSFNYVPANGGRRRPRYPDLERLDRRDAESRRDSWRPRRSVR